MPTNTRQTVKEEIEARELHRAALHEAAHLVVLSAFGGYGTARVWPNPSGAIDETAWLGQVQMLAEPGKLPMSPEVMKQLNVLTPLPDRWRVQFGLAGKVAEYMYEGDSDAESVFSRLHKVLKYEVSETDAAAMGSDWDVADVASTVALLQARWDEVKMNAESLMNSVGE